MTLYAKPEDVLTSSVGDELLLLNADSEDYYSLNEVGALMFEHLAKGLDFDHVVELIVTEFDAPNAVVRTDLERTVAELLDRGLLVVAGS